jgi:hypothetical protein
MLAHRKSAFAESSHPKPAYREFFSNLLEPNPNPSPKRIEVRLKPNLIVRTNTAARGALDRHLGKLRSLREEIRLALARHKVARKLHARLCAARRGAIGFVKIEALVVADFPVSLCREG